MKPDASTARLPMSPAAEADALCVDPWEGDRDSDAVTLRDGFVTTRKPASCAICFGSIAVGTRVRSQTQRSEEMRKVMTFKFCDACCRAMVVVVDWPDFLELRYELGMERAQLMRAGTESGSSTT